ncbi:MULTISPECIES: type II secretion system assembly factor GspB [Dickeya]|uniref:General secretion pathway protein B n=1 Tax=Dickeya aquatica TaxID=1401087 RepID=A0A375A847_9GAMM|nr:MULTISPECIES: type II secretion system assembly factor GspB [Dickeya]SLM62244.1 General secretion pathway protein B [Dickeya aquatica]
MENTPEVSTSYQTHYRIPGYLLIVYAVLVFGLGWFAHQRWSDIHPPSTSTASAATIAHPSGANDVVLPTHKNNDDASHRTLLQPGATALATALAEPSPEGTEETSAAPTATVSAVKGWQTAKPGELPYIAFSAHVYTSDTDKRSVTLNGERYREGDMPYPGLIIEQIEQDMVILSFDGEPFILDSLQDWPGGKPDTDATTTNDESGESKPTLKAPKAAKTAKRD